MTTTDDVTLLEITQATTATFTELYIRHTFFFFIQSGSKRVLCSTSGEVIGQEGDLMIFPPGAIVTMENRPIMENHYRAVGVSFSDSLIETVFAGERAQGRTRGGKDDVIQLVRAEPEAPAALLAVLRDTLERSDLPEPLRRHRLMEPLVWLRHRGYGLSARPDESPMGRVRRLIETDLSRSWRASEVAEHLAMSEPTMRRVLARSGQSFAKIILYTRLEHGLSRLQTTADPISEIALDVGFKTPSHFSDAFRKRFGISPRQIRTVEN